MLLAGGFLLFWLVDIVTGEPGLRGQAFRTFAWNTGIVVIGIVLCAILIRPAATNDAVTAERPTTIAVPLAKAAFIPGDKLQDLARIPHGTFLPETGDHKLLKLLLSALLFGSVLGLARRPAALMAALVTLLLFSVFFMFIYPGEYRHDELWLTFLVSTYWIAETTMGKPDGIIPQSWRPVAARAAKAGWICFLLLLLIQVPIGIANAFSDIGFGLPFSRSADFGDLMRSRPDLQNAVVIADPDFLVEPLPYYVTNPTYLLREQRFGKVVTFTTQARMELSLDNILSDAQRLRSEMNRPVLILMQQDPDPSLPGTIYPEAYEWKLEITPEQARRFQNATELLKRFGPARRNESFGVYLLK